MEIEAFKIPRLAEDLITVCDKLELEQDGFVLLGSSMGANAILEGLKLSARAILGYQIWENLENITAPVAIGFAASDTLHKEQDIHDIAHRIPGCQAIECPSSTYMHTAAVVSEIDRFLASALDEPESIEAC